MQLQTLLCCSYTYDMTFITIFKIRYKLYTAAGSITTPSPPLDKFWVHTLYLQTKKPRLPLIPLCCPIYKPQIDFTYSGSMKNNERAFKKQQNIECTLNVPLRRGRKLLLPWKSNKFYLWVCVCVRACLRTDTQVRGCVHARTCMQPCLSSMQCIWAILLRLLWLLHTFRHIS
jgi:hypothetical protein